MKTSASVLLIAFASAALAQRISPMPSCALSPQVGTYPTPPLTYPKTSDRYAVQFAVNGGTWTNAPVYISYYGGSNSSPFLSYSGYSADTSMSFASIPVQANAAVQLRVTKLWDAPFLAGDQVSVRPSSKGISAALEAEGTVLISTETSSIFAGEQFILWWNRGAEGGAVESLVFFLDPPYTRPSGSNVKVIQTAADLGADLSAFDTLDIEGTLAVPPRPGMAAVPAGAVALNVPINITSIFLAQGAWLQGKLHFLQSGIGQQRRVYGPGVLDVSRFEYDLRFCDSSSAYPDQSYGSISLSDVGASGKPDQYILDGIVIADQNLYATDLLSNSTLNNVKVLGWNGNNDGFELGVNTSVSNVFVRSGDDSLKMWRSSITIKNATIWQNYNGGVVNLGWYKDSPGDSGLIDGLYVVKTDWLSPTTPSWNWAGLADQNNGVFVSLMVPGTSFGVMQPSVFRNIYVEDPPQVLFSLKILPPRCTQGGVPAPCPQVNLEDQAELNLEIQNLYSPASIAQNSIGFETLPTGYTLGTAPPPFPLPHTLTGSMNIGLTNIFLTPPNGSATALTSANAATLGKLTMNGNNINLTYASTPLPTITLVANAEGESPAIAPNTWVEIKGTNLAPSGDSRIWKSADFTNNQMPVMLDGVSVTVNGKSAFVYYISPTQVNILTPPDAISGMVQVIVTNNGATSAAYAVQAQSTSPSFFLFNGGPYVAATHANGSYVGPASLYPGMTTPAKLSETVVLYANGFGPTSSPIVGGSPSQSGTLTPPPTIKIGGLTATVTFAGLVLPGEFQFNVVVPQTLADGDQPISAAYGGVSTPAGALITIQH
jgi:uncharacterized protein (TIGR03437 family)